MIFHCLDENVQELMTSLPTIHVTCQLKTERTIMLSLSLCLLDPVLYHLRAVNAC